MHLYISKNQCRFLIDLLQGVIDNSVKVTIDVINSKQLLDKLLVLQSRDV